jgi:hypothetical protein
MKQETFDLHGFNKQSEAISNDNQIRYFGVILEEDQYFCYLWYEKGHEQECTFGERWVKAGENPWKDCLLRMKESVNKQGAHFKGENFEMGEYIPVAIFNVSEYANKYDIFAKQKRVDDHIRGKLNIPKKEGHREKHVTDPVTFHMEVNKLLAKEGQPLPQVTLSSPQYRGLNHLFNALKVASVVLGMIDPRIGKTIMGIVLSRAFKLTIVASYIKTVKTSYRSDLCSYEQFKNDVFVDCQSIDYQEKILSGLNEGKNVIAYLSMCPSSGEKNLRQERINFLYGASDNILTIMEEPDLGLHTPGQTDPLKVKATEGDNKVVFLVGSNADRAINGWRGLVQETVIVPYTQAILDKEGTSLSDKTVY